VFATQETCFDNVILDDEDVGVTEYADISDQVEQSVSDREISSSELTLEQILHKDISNQVDQSETEGESENDSDSEQPPLEIAPVIPLFERPRKTRPDRPIPLRPFCRTCGKSREELIASGPKSRERWRTHQRLCAIEKKEKEKSGEERNRKKKKQKQKYNRSANA